jgi:hypothetical protein
MATNDEIIAEMPTVIRGSVFDIETALNKARADTAKQLLAKLQKCIYYCDSHGGYTHMDWKLLKETFPELNLQKVD